MIFEGSFGVKPRPGGDTRVWERFSVPHTVGFEFDAFPLQVGYLTEQQQTLAPHTHWIPLGFNVLIEGNAQAIQMRCLEATYPQDINNAFLAAQTARRFELPMDEEIDAAALGKSLVQPYRITDLLISKFLNSKYGDKAKFPRERILELTDRALMASILPEFPSKKARSAGAAFLSIMEKANWPGRRGEPITYSPYDKDELISFRKEMISCPLPEKVEDSISFYSVLNYIEYYVRHRIIAPMLKLRIDFGNKIFYDPDCYMENFTKFPTAPMIIEDGNFYPAADLDRNFPKRWSQYMMLSSVAESIWQRRSIIPCPRAYPEMSMGLTNFEFCADREDTIETMGCRKMIATRRCLTWDNKRKRPLPDCHFGLITKGLRLAPWTS
jgi:hypothetical protein